MKLLGKTILLFILLFSAQIGRSQLVEDGVFYLKEEQYEKAITLLKAELSKSPNDARINYLIGEAYFALGNFSESKAAYTAASADLKSPFGLLGLGKIELQNGNKSGAFLLFDKAIKLEKKNPAIYASVAKACLQVAAVDTASARIYLERGLAVSNKNASIQMVTGDLNLIKKNYGPAANDYERVFLYDKNSYEAYRNLGVMFTLAKNYIDAKKNFEQSIAIAPNQILGYKKYAELYYNYGKYVEAEKYYSIYYAKVNPSISEVEKYAFIMFFNKKYKEASALLDKVMAQKGDQANVAIYRIKGYISYENGDYVGGLEYMKKLFALKNTADLLGSDYAYNARLLAKNNQDSLAVDNYKLAIGKEENPVDYLDELAKVYVKLKAYNNAADVYSTVMVAGGDKSAGNFNIGKLYYQAGDEQRQLLFNITPVADAKGRVAPMSVAGDSIKAKMLGYYRLSDSCFAIVNELSPNYATGFMWRGRIQSILDPEAKGTLGKDYYEKTLEVLAATSDKVKGKKSFVECYNYLGSYNYFGSERSKGEEAKQFKEKSLSYFQMILDIDPNDAVTKDKIEKLKATK